MKITQEMAVYRTTTRQASRLLESGLSRDHFHGRGCWWWGML